MGKREELEVDSGVGVRARTTIYYNLFFGFLLDGKRKYDTFLGPGSEDIKDHYKGSDVSLSFGGGYDFPFGLGLDVPYDLSVKDISDAANGDPAKRGCSWFRWGGIF